MRVNHQMIRIATLKILVLIPETRKSLKDILRIKYICLLPKQSLKCIVKGNS